MHWLATGLVPIMLWSNATEFCLLCSNYTPYVSQYAPQIQVRFHKSLYTCIPHKEGMQACAEALEIAKPNNPDQLDTNTLINLLEIVLKNNTFQFNGKSYIQLQGTAMGTKLAPAYANIFMGKLEHTILSSAPLKPSYYRRYIDDVLIL